MASSILGIAKKLRNLKTNTVLSVTLRRSLSSTETSKVVRERRKRMSNLIGRISPLGHPSISIVPVLDQWAQEPHKISHQKLRDLIHSLRIHRRYTHALQVSEWMSSKGIRLSSGDCAIRLDLIGKVRGVDSAESFFNSISDFEEKGKVYGALLNCYVRESLIDKSLSHMQKMKDLGLVNTLSYNSIMCLYTDTDQLDKIPNILSEMRKDGFTPDNFSYRMCINSYGRRSDLDGVERILKEMESQQPRIVSEWRTYAMVANIFINAGENEKSLIYLKKCENLVGKDALGYNYLISNHAKLGHKDEMMRLWGLQKAKCKKQINRDYVTILGLLVKLGDFEEAEKWLKEWESTCQFYDFRVPNILLIGYCQNGLTEKAEEMLREMITKGKTPIPNSWAIIAAGYLDRKNMDNAFECIKEALAIRTENKWWRPKSNVLMAILDWLVDSRDVDEVEAYVNSMKNAIPINREMCHSLIKAYIRAGKEVDVVLERMRSDGIDLDEETEKILSSSNSEN